MPNWDDPFVPSMEEIEVAKEEVYEAALVKQLLKYYNLLHLQRHLLSLSEELTFKGFMDQQGFPMWITPCHVKGVDSDTFLRLRGAPTKTPIYEAWAAAGEQVPEELSLTPRAIVFRWTGWTKFVALHNRQADRRSRGARLTLHIRDEVLHLESLEDLLVDLGGPTALES